MPGQSLTWAAVTSAPTSAPIWGATQHRRVGPRPMPRRVDAAPATAVESSANMAAGIVSPVADLALPTAPERADTVPRAPAPAGRAPKTVAAGAGRGAETVRGAPRVATGAARDATGAGRVAAAAAKAAGTVAKAATAAARAAAKGAKRWRGAQARGLRAPRETDFAWHRRLGSAALVAEDVANLV